MQRVEPADLSIRTPTHITVACLEQVGMGDPVESTLRIKTGRSFMCDCLALQETVLVRELDALLVEPLRLEIATVQTSDLGGHQHMLVGEGGRTGLLGPGHELPVMGVERCAQHGPLIGRHLIDPRGQGERAVIVKVEMQAGCCPPAGRRLVLALGLDHLGPKPRLRPVGRRQCGAVVSRQEIQHGLASPIVPVHDNVARVGQPGCELGLVEFLVALPIGAVVGGGLGRRVPHRVVAAAGLVLATVGFLLMAAWGPESLHYLSSSAVLAVTGLGFGLALAPTNATLLAWTDAAAHGVSSALVVVARMIGMLIGISALTTIGLRRYYAVEADIASPHEVCGALSTRCSAYTDLLQHAALEELQAIFVGAALCALLGAGVALLGFKNPVISGIRD